MPHAEESWDLHIGCVCSMINGLHSLQVSASYNRGSYFGGWGDQSSEHNYCSRAAYITVGWRTHTLELAGWYESEYFLSIYLCNFILYFSVCLSTHLLYTLRTTGCVQRVKRHILGCILLSLVPPGSFQFFFVPQLKHSDWLTVFPVEEQVYYLLSTSYFSDSQSHFITST